ncbi:hypothetical protein [uncultured Prevotella sp.]|uniref:hypothetical protein n=1 Tax=uncultured Prevotella sp. TaxID=159272 RepID=UPI0025F39E0E|nr:hypothetical protein [uncultured Prevotella sp.]
MKKKLFFAAIALTTLAGCTDESYVGDQSLLTNDGGAISFNMETATVTRAGGSSAATSLNNNFVLFGYKTVSSTPQTVFDNYQVNFVANTQLTTESNSAGWEYVNYKNLPYGTTTDGTTSPIVLNNNGVASNATATGIDQSIKYWDYNASQYDFFAYSLGKGTGDPKTYAKASALAASTYTLEGTANQLGECYISNKKIIVPSSTSPTEVQLEFLSFLSKVELKFYETIPGYSVKDVKFYPAATGTSTTTPALYGSNIPIGGQYKITFDTNGKPQLALETTSPAPTTDTKINTFSSTLSNYATKEYEEATGNYLGRTSNAATSTDVITVLPNPQNSNALNLKMDFTLVSRDKTGEEITCTGATAVIPAAYAQWKPNYKYTYIFKISDNTNTTTGSIIGLYPITLDATVTDAQDGSQETITTVSIPSITTYAKGVNPTAAATAEYKKSSNIYVVVDKSGTLQTLTVGTNAKLYLVTNTTGDGAATQEITEASVANALEHGTKDNESTPTTWTVTGAGMKSLIVTTTGVPTLTAVSSILATDSPTGDAIDIDGTNNNCAKFTPTSAGIYAFEFIDTSDSNKKYYKIIKVVD